MKSYLLFIGFLFFTLSVSAQLNGEAIYTIENLVSFSKHENEDVNTALKLLEEQSSTTEDIEFKMLFSGEKSVFFFEELLEVDESNKFNLALIKAKTLGEFYSNYSTNTILNKKDAMGQNYLIESSLNDIRWSLKNETRQIGEYKCYKALTTRKILRKGSYKEIVVEAWYSPQISVKGGPIGYGGLPGLIVELNYGDMFLYSLKEISFKDINLKKLKTPKGKKAISQKEYDTILLERGKKGFKRWNKKTK